MRFHPCVVMPSWLCARVGQRSRALREPASHKNIKIATIAAGKDLSSHSSNCTLTHLTWEAHKDSTARLFVSRGGPPTWEKRGPCESAPEPLRGNFGPRSSPQGGGAAKLSDDSGNCRICCGVIAVLAPMLRASQVDIRRERPFSTRRASHPRMRKDC